MAGKLEIRAHLYRLKCIKLVVHRILILSLASYAAVDVDDAVDVCDGRTNDI